MATTTIDAAEGVVRPELRTGALAIAGIASLGAGAVHAAAIGVHAEHRAAVVTFAVLALLQLVWGAVALVRQGRVLAWAGVLLGAGAVGGWILAKTTGLDAIDGLGEVEAIQWPDLLAAALAATSLLVALRRAVTGAAAAGPGGVGSAPPRWTLHASAVVLTALAMGGMVTAGGHTHAEGAGHDHGSGPGAGAEVAAADGHAHAHGDGTGSTAADGTTETTHAHTTTAIAPKPYDPTKPIDLGGVAGVTEEQQAAAENLIAITLIRLPHFADYRTAMAEGYHSINDGITGHEHFIRWDAIDDDHILDPDHPESLVYAVGPRGERELVSAMFMLPTGKTLADVPELGGKLTQWHIHDNLCFSDDPVAPTFAGITSSGGECPPGLRNFTPVPMIHVWITEHPCGPFAALEGVGAGQIEEGEERLCDTAHGH